MESVAGIKWNGWPGSSGIRKRIAERTCDMPWHEIRRALEKLQVTKLFDLNHNVYLRNEIPSQTGKILKKLNIKSPYQLISIEKKS